MKKAISLLLTTMIFLVPVGSALGWGDDGHQTVGKIASPRIKPKAAQKVAQILNPGETLANIASWADTVKERMGKTDPDPDTNAFLQDIAHNEKIANGITTIFHSTAKTTRRVLTSLPTTTSYTCSTFAFARFRAILIRTIH